MLSSLKRFTKDEVAQERLRIINFYRKYGEKATKEAFKVDRKLVYIWRKRLTVSGKQLASLIPLSTKPKRTRQMTTNQEIVAHIRSLREDHPRLGKEKIKPLLDDYCQEKEIASISISTIGKVIKRNRLFFQKQGRIYHSPNSGWAKRNRLNPRLRVKYSPKPGEIGHLQLDTVCKLVDGVRRYLYSAIDVYSKTSLSLPYPRLTSRNTLDFFHKLQLFYPGVIKSVQTDNGLEFLGVFDAYLKRINLPHYFIYPRCPRINGVVERYQRSLNEEFIQPNLDLIHDPKAFSGKLADYLLFYNTKRVHKSLGNQTPIDFLLKEGGMSKMSVTYTDTGKFQEFLIK